MKKREKIALACLTTIIAKHPALDNEEKGEWSEKKSKELHEAMEATVRGAFTYADLFLLRSKYPQKGGVVIDSLTEFSDKLWHIVKEKEEGKKK